MRSHRAQYKISAPFVQVAAQISSYSLISLNTDDVSSMVALQLRCGTKNVVARNADFYHAHFEDGHTAIGFIDHRGALVAHALIINHSKDTKILNVLVDPQHRGQGMQLKMIHSWLDTAYQNGLSTATAFVRVDNTTSFDNFVKVGMAITETKPSPEEPYHMIHVMKRPLQSWPVREQVKDMRWEP